MTEKPTIEPVIPAVVDPQPAEPKNGNDQGEAAKRLAEANKKKDEQVKELEAKLEAAKKGEPATVEKPEINPDMLEAAKAALSEQNKTEGKVNEIFTKWPEFKEHEKKIRKFLADDTRKGVPIEEVIAGAIGAEALMKMGASMNVERLQASAESEAGGGNAEAKVLTEAEKASADWKKSIPEQFK